MTVPRAIVPLLAAVAALAVAACARLPYYFPDYPAVPVAPARRLVGPAGDSLWVREVGLVTVVSRHRAAVDSVPAAVLESAPDVHRRALGRRATPVTVVLTRQRRAGLAEEPRPALPEALARGAVLWGHYLEGDTLPRARDRDQQVFVPQDEIGGIRTQRRPWALPVNDGLESTWSPGMALPVELMAAQHWVDADIAANGPLPNWLEAALVSAIGEGMDRMPASAIPLLPAEGLRWSPPLDSLLRRDCGPDWKAVPGLPGLRVGQVSKPRPSRADWAPWLRDRCGVHMRVQAYSLLRFLVDEAGWEVVPLLVADARAGRPFEATLARFAALPSTREGVDDLWRRWLRRNEGKERPR